MTVQDSYLEKTWDDLLSRNKDRIVSRFASLDPESQKNVMDHLKRMVSEADWHPEQVASARSALQALEKQGH